MSNVVMSRRSYEDTHKCSSRLWFNTTTTEKGDKSVSNTEALLLLEETETVRRIIQQSRGDQSGVAKAFLSDVTTNDFRKQFRCFFWGDISCLFRTCLRMSQCSWDPKFSFHADASDIMLQLRQRGSNAAQIPQDHVYHFCWRCRQRFWRSTDLSCPGQYVIELGCASC